MGELYGELGQALGYLGDPAYWIVLFIAVFIAGFTGMVPGASGVIIMAISIPFIVEFFGRDRGGPNDMRAIGLVALASMTGVNNTLDSIPAVLFGQPSAATQVTFLEGHQLARQGRAAHTLGAVYAVSAMGGIIGATVLALLIPVAKPIILKFSFPEIAAVAFFGIAMVAALSAGAMVKGLAAGGLGVLLGTVGINAITGDVRFVFSQPSLWEGLPIVVVTIGFFALPEMIDLAIARRPVAPPDSVVNTREVWRGSRYGFTRWPMVIRQSVFGVILGAIPGVGAAVIDWLSYAFGIFWTKDKSQFGKGSLDGVLFAESAQNSKEAGQALPTLTLGVPGGLAWVLVYVAMQALDMTPGPRLLGDQADVMILFVLTLGIGNLIVTMIGIFATGQLAKLTRIPYPLIGGVFIPIVIFSTVMNWTTWLALPVAAVFAGIGIIMKLFQWPRPPLLLGIILGPIIEKNFLSALNVVEPFNIAGYESDILGVLLRPLTVALIVIAIATAYFFSRAAQGQTLTSAAAQPPAGASGTGSQEDTAAPARQGGSAGFPFYLLFGIVGLLLWIVSLSIDEMSIRLGGLHLVEMTPHEGLFIAHTLVALAFLLMVARMGEQRRLLFHLRIVPMLVVGVLVVLLEVFLLDIWPRVECASDCPLVYGSDLARFMVVVVIALGLALVAYARNSAGLLWQWRNAPLLFLIGGAMAFEASSLGLGSRDAWFLSRLMALFIIILGLVQLYFHLRDTGHRHADIMDLGMHSLALPGATQAIWVIAGGFLMFAMLTGTIGLRWAVLALAGYLPFTLLAGSSLPLSRSIIIGVVIGALSGIAASLIGITGVSEIFAQNADAVADTGQIIGASATVAVAVTVALSINARGVGGMPGAPGVMGVVALAFLVAVAIAAGMTRGGYAEVPLLAAGGVFTLLLLLIRPIREYQPAPALHGLFAWRILGPVITMSFVFLFIYGMADNVLSVIWPQPALFEWIGREILGSGA